MAESDNPVSLVWLDRGQNTCRITYAKLSGYRI